jgi:outer membrane protein TolC
MRTGGRDAVRFGTVGHAVDTERETVRNEAGARAAPAQASAAAVPSGPPQDRALSYDDCVLMASQYAPDLVSGIIDLELAEVAADNAFWRRMPFISARFRVTANLTKQHKEYSDTSSRMDFGIYGFEPVVSYFSHKAALLLQDIALSTHQKAVEKRGEEIASALLRLATLERAGERQAADVGLAKQLTAFQRTRQAMPVDRLKTASALHQERAAQAALDKTKVEISSLCLSLKLMLGYDPDRRLAARGASVEELLQREKAALALADRQWEEVWRNSLDARIAKVSLKLKDYNIMMAWARYLPNMNMEIIPANPASDYASYSSKDDVFARMYLTLPLLDWGERSRGVDSARLDKAQVSQRAKLGRQIFSQQWQEHWLAMKMAQADVELARELLSVARLEEQKAELQHRAGSIAFDGLIDARRARLSAESALEEASLQLRLRELAAWMLSGGFSRRFFEPRADEERE